ncbi:MAG: RND transporter [Gammaproteobacteria bacterium]|nr:RND transporter [Gammaproteobacteria bacterium]
MLTWLDKVPLYVLLIAALTLGLAPFVPQPHLLEKLQLLTAGSLTRPIDIFDLLLHGTPMMLLALKLLRSYLLKSSPAP